MKTMDVAASGKGRWISTGNQEIDKKLGGGIPVGSLILVGGESDSGKSVLSQQLTWGSLREGFKISVLTTENTVRSFISQMKSLNLDVQDGFLLRRLNVFPIKATRAQSGADGALDALLAAVDREAQSRDIVIIDSVTSFIARTSPEDTVAFFEDCKVLCNTGLTLIVVAHPHAFNESTLVRISSMSDTNLYLSNENVGEKLMKVLEVRKVRGAEKTTGNIVSFDVEPGWGMRIIPFTKARA
jgi:flagellar protein FlaH